MKKLLLLVAYITNCTAAHISPTQYAAIADLAIAIEQSDAALLEKTVRKHPFVLTVRLEPYGDTPLMAALRKYGQALQAEYEHPTKITAFSLLKGLGVGVIAGKLVGHFVGENSGLVTTWVTFAAACLAFSQHSTKAQERVVAVLLRATPHLHPRNHEGLTALDILRAYHHYAQELKATSWFHFHAHLQNSQHSSQ